MKNKKLIVIALVLVLLIGGMAGLWLGSREGTVEGAKSITVAVVHADGSEKNFEYNTDEEFLGAVILAEGLVEGEKGPYGLVISAVDGEKAVWEENGAYWALFIGEEYATTGADTTPIADGGVYKLVYTVG